MLAVHWNPGWGCWLELTRVACPLHVTRTSSHHGGWAQEQALGLAWKPAGRHFLRVTGEAVAEPRLSQTWGGVVQWPWVVSSVKNLGGSVLKAPRVHSDLLRLRFSTCYYSLSDGEMAGSHVY